MKLYRFSPITNRDKLFEAIQHIHFSSFELCKTTFGSYLPVAGNMGVFCHYDDEYDYLIEIRKEITEDSDNINQKYFRLLEPIIIPAKGDVPETTYTHLYVRKPDPYRFHVGDVDFVLDETEYTTLKNSLLQGTILPGGRIFPRADLDMIELFHPDNDVLAYVSPREMTERARIKQTL